MENYEIVSDNRMEYPQTYDADTNKLSGSKERTTKENMINAVADNFDNILKLASDLAEIRKKQVQSQADLAKMQEERKWLIDEAEAYAMKKNADTKSVIERMTVIRLMMNDFYLNASHSQITSEDFSKIITEIVNQMGRISDNEQ